MDMVAGDYSLITRQRLMYSLRFLPFTFFLSIKIGAPFFFCPFCQFLQMSRPFASKFLPQWQSMTGGLKNVQSFRFKKTAIESEQPVSVTHSFLSVGMYITFDKALRFESLIFRTRIQDSASCKPLHYPAIEDADQLREVTCRVPRGCIARQQLLVSHIGPSACSIYIESLPLPSILLSSIQIRFFNHGREPAQHRRDHRYLFFSRQV